MQIESQDVWLAISHPARRAILERLLDGPARVTDLAEPFEISLNAVSKHIKVLERAQLLRRSYQGREQTLELNPAPLQEVAEWTVNIQKFWSARLDRIEQFFKNREKDR
jgi:DNA-binding transcriptional ArsR family regulator